MSHKSETNCLFCLKSITVESCERESKEPSSCKKSLVKTFLIASERYLQTSFSQRTKSNELLSLLAACPECSLIVGTFCTLSHEVQCLDLRIQFALQNLMGVMERAEPVESSSNATTIPDLKSEVREEKNVTPSGLLEDIREQFFSKC